MDLFRRSRARPAPRHVAARAAALRVVVHFAMVPLRDDLTVMMASWSPAELREFEARMAVLRDDAWKTLKPLHAHFSPWEVEFLRSTMITMTTSQQLQAMWRAEALLVLMWALELYPEIPPYDVQAEPTFLETHPLPEFDSHLLSAVLRPDDTIARARKVAELWHWRSRMEQLIRDCQPFPQSSEMTAAGFRSFDDIVRFTAAHANDDGSVFPIIDGDLAVFGKRYRDLSEDEWSFVQSVTLERHFALNWLCGYAPANKWDETPTET